MMLMFAFGEHFADAVRMFAVNITAIRPQRRRWQRQWKASVTSSS